MSRKRKLIGLGRNTIICVDSLSDIAQELANAVGNGFAEVSSDFDLQSSEGFDICFRILSPIVVNE